MCINVQISVVRVHILHVSVQYSVPSTVYRYRWFLTVIILSKSYYLGGHWHALFSWCAILLFVHVKKDPQRFSVLCCLLAFYLAIMVLLILLAGLTSYSAKKLKNGAKPLYFTLSAKPCVCVGGVFIPAPDPLLFILWYNFCFISIWVVRSPRQRSRVQQKNTQISGYISVTNRWANKAIKVSNCTIISNLVLTRYKKLASLMQKIAIHLSCNTGTMAHLMIVTVHQWRIFT